MHILFLTSNNLATNPRLYKELKLTLEQGYFCTLIQFKLGNWSDFRSDELLVKIPIAIGNELKRVQVINIDATSKNKLSWFKWGILEKFSQKLYPIFKNSIKINALASSRRAFQLLYAAKRLKEQPDLICAHNLGALYPAWKLSQKWNIPFVFDVEDYHPGEMIRFDAKSEKQRREFLMQKLLPKASALTSASPLIGEYTLKLIGGHPNHHVVLNSFPLNEFTIPIANNQQLKTTNGALRLVWFSQKISFGRGLEQLFEALLLLLSSNDLITFRSINLTLIGDLDPAFDQQIIQPFLSHIQTSKHPNITHLNIENPLSQPDLHAELANHDIGLALEFNNTDLNRQLCLTNKIIAYAQAGLYILATDTPAQQQFMQEHDNAGVICGQTSEAISNAILKISDEGLLIKEEKPVRFKKGKELAWEKEAEKLKNLWKEVLGPDIR